MDLIRLLVKTVVMTIVLLSLIGCDGTKAPGKSVDPVAVMFTDDRDGKTYHAVKIGKLVWMAENLNYKTKDSWCYNNVDTNCVKYGRLYTWDAAMAACPAGWRLSDTTDWQDLITVVGGLYENKKLRSKTGWGWLDEYGINVYGIKDDGTDDVGFSALPCGHLHPDYGFDHLGICCAWWTATEYTPGRSMYFSVIPGYDDEVVVSVNMMDFGYAVRCVRGEVRQ
ncbi:MAG: fibrobacter succinogenes major paralogous domain-containing protein [Chitinispirillia bacterium]|nr:fibrobacter succinogenes major paralogous domain-containing protein [Chitinispirillia bacterium]MCL2268547.1 fibrobacter succinogenes major paralogous domain-containing protein [Chitinispirillia bacterium]